MEKNYQKASGKAVRFFYLFFLIGIVSCQEDPEKQDSNLQIDQRDKDKILALGFDTTDLQVVDDYYLVENDVLLRKKHLDSYFSTEESKKAPSNGKVDQARVTTALISLVNQRNISVFVNNTIPVGGTDDWRTEVQQAINQINNVPNSRIRLQYVTVGPADITIQAGTFANNVIAAGEWPITVSGVTNAGPNIRINLTYDSNRDVTTGQKLYNMVHEIGHCLGLRHTNWLAFGESTPIGITGTPNSGTNPDPNSVMNGGTANHTWVGFSSYDRIAFSSLYPAMRVTISGPAKGDNQGTYTWSVSAANGIGPYTYVWRYGYDGVNYNGSFGTGTSVTAQLPLDRDLYLRVTGTASDGEQAIDEHTTLNFGSIKPR